ncbi:MAG: serine hydrolase [Verrucomicrobia bacterium]|nr:serine hydrolase [Verrucomicrobiota bacterium]
MNSSSISMAAAVRRSSAVVGAFVVALGPSLLGAQPSVTIEQRIQHIENAILPAMLVQGETPSTTKLIDRMAALRVPGVSVAVLHDGKIEWARGFGVARMDGPPVTPETLFQAASISKAVAAVGALHVAEAGKLALDADVNQHLKTWKVPANALTEKSAVTLRNLLNHTAGLTGHGFPGYVSDAMLPSNVQVLNGEKPANTAAVRVDKLPGTEWRYSGGGYTVMQVLLEDVTGKPFSHLMHDFVLQPFGMNRSMFEQPLPKNQMAEAAAAYHADGAAVRGGPHVYPEMAAAGLWTTPSDLLRFAMGVQQALAGSSKAVLSAGMTREMLTPGMNQWGLGVQTGGSAGHRYFTHGGSNVGFQCILVAYETGDGAAIMTNGDRGGELAKEILRTIAHDYQWPDFGPEENAVGKTADVKTLARYAGAYQMAPGTNMVVTLDGSQLVAKPGNQSAVPIFPESETKFFAKVGSGKIELEFTQPDPSGVPGQLVMRQNGRARTMNRLSDAGIRQIEAERKEIADASAAAVKRLNDQTPDPRTEAALRRNIDDLLLGQPKYEKMSSGLANATRQQLPQLISNLTKLGALQSVTFKGVGPGGVDIYEVKFEHGSTEWRILMQSDEKVASLGFRAQQS